MYRFFRLLVLALFLAAPSALMAGEALVNSDAEVDITGKDAADARAQAMTKGQMDALLALLNKLTTPEQAQGIADTVDSGKLAAMVRGTEVLDEKMAGNHYHAHLMVTFDGTAISQLIGSPTAPAKGGEETATASSFLIVPDYEEGGAAMLWEDDNPWRTAWKTVGLEITSGDIVVPFGDATDNGVVDAKTIGSATYNSLAPLTVRYGASDIIILQAKFTQAPDMVLTVIKRRINRGQSDATLLTYRADPQETKGMLMLRAARDIADTLQHKKTEEVANVKTVHGGERNQVMVLASISTLASWTQLRTKLTKLPMIDQLEMLALSPQQVDMVIHYRGSPESLANAVIAQNIRLVQNPTYWVISRD